MRKLFSLCVIVTLSLMMGCAMLDLIGQPLQTYTFNYDGQDYSVFLPKEVPLPSETATLHPDWFPGWGKLTVMHVICSATEQYPVISFWFTKESGVVALIFHTADEHIPYLYIKGLPIKVSGDEIEALLDKLMGKSPKQTSPSLYRMG